MPHDLTEKTPDPERPASQTAPDRSNWVSEAVQSVFNTAKATVQNHYVDGAAVAAAGLIVARPALVAAAEDALPEAALLIKEMGAEGASMIRGIGDKAMPAAETTLKDIRPVTGEEAASGDFMPGSPSMFHYPPGRFSTLGRKAEASLERALDNAASGRSNGQLSLGGHFDQSLAGKLYRPTPQEAYPVGSHNFSALFSGEKPLPGARSFSIERLTPPPAGSDADISQFMRRAAERTLRLGDRSVDDSAGIAAGQLEARPIQPLASLSERLNPTFGLKLTRPTEAEVERFGNHDIHKLITDKIT